MFEQVFRKRLSDITRNPGLVDKLWHEIKEHYSAAGRHYHTLAHLDQVFTELTAIEDPISDWQTLVFSIAYHDIIYNTMRNDNEERSAKLAGERMTQVSLPLAQIEKCHSQIMATKSHEKSEDTDTNYFTDADLAILGSDNNKYREYADLIRKEYKFYPDFMYNPGRQKVLKHFLGTKRIYKTDHFYEKYEKTARENISEELIRLVN